MQHMTPNRHRSVWQTCTCTAGILSGATGRSFRASSWTSSVAELPPLPMPGPMLPPTLARWLLERMGFRELPSPNPVIACARARGRLFEKI